MILRGEAILERLKGGQIFKQGTWDEGLITEASYALRVASDGLMLGGKTFLPEKDFLEGDIKIDPGEIAILSTIERLDMPGDLVGKIGIRFDYASQGLTGLMGIQVDPFYGWGHTTADTRGRDERLYIRVANLGNETISIPLRADVFTFELHNLDGRVPEPTPTPRLGMWHRLQDILKRRHGLGRLRVRGGERVRLAVYLKALACNVKRIPANQDHASWSNVTKVQFDVGSLTTRFESATKEVRDYLQPLVMFGIFLIAVTILGVALTVIVTGSDTPETYVPTWVRDWAWKVLLGTLSFAASVTGVIGLIIVGGLALRTFSKGQ